MRGSMSLRLRVSKDLHQLGRQLGPWSRDAAAPCETGECPRPPQAILRSLGVAEFPTPPRQPPSPSWRFSVPGRGGVSGAWLQAPPLVHTADLVLL